MEKIILENPWIIIVLAVWTIPWKGWALWKAARQNQPGWFIVLLIANTLAILDILYIFIFSRKKPQKEILQTGLQPKTGIVHNLRRPQLTL